MDFSNLAAFLDTLPDAGIPGCDCAVWYDHRPVFRHMSGFADRKNGRAMAGNELYFIYSASKPITCVTAMTLYEKGGFLLNDPLYEYLPEYRHMTVRDENGEHPAERDITIRDLFTMSAGFEYDLFAGPIAALRSSNPNFTTREFAREHAKLPLIFEPGTRFNYSLCHDIIGALIEVVSGMSFGEYMKKAVLDPIGMKNTGFRMDDIYPERMAAQYEYDNEKGETHEYPLDNSFRAGSSRFESGGAGLVSCVDDYILFADMLSAKGLASSGERILSPSTIDLMRTNHLDDTRRLRDFNWQQVAGYGYGLGVRTMVDRSASGSAGSVGEFGWDGAAGAYMLADPERRLAIFYGQQVLGNRAHVYVHPRIRNIVYSCIDR